ncbi:hypothetical protein SOVF_030470 [Spinacia oleracea]|uniref:TRF2/HOY1 PH-like domain-containing protein n=1 Tax=Spinacia oleracea TaxID=3562 RepID=A0A9R0J160_SPIOL|nr:uncharacterized protein LOC110798556 [Spinacia oleracea]KNA22839.1 hypothetical protein SOVF_030470 [Spinacia oleracea]
MVHRMDTVEEFPAQGKLCKRKVKVKVKAEFDDSASDGTHGPFLSKRPKFDFVNNGNVEVLEYNPLKEPSPLGLKLKKSPSFLDLIQMKLSQEKSARKEKGASAAATDSKLKASNFPATVLKIGTWEYKSRYEGDLVAKCYFAKHKLVWEVLDGGLKNKIEIQWSDIMAIKANYLDNEPGTLDVVLSRQPLFFREINPQPRKHTLWQATTDFTSGQASLHRQHFLQFPEGTLGKHFQKLIQCDPRLSFLSQQPQTELDTPYFQPRVSIFGDQSNTEHGFELKTGGRFSFSGIRDTLSVSGLSSSDIENQNPIGSLKETSQKNQLIPDMNLLEGDVSSKYNNADGLKFLNEIKLPGLHPSMSVGDLVNHIGDCISEQMRSDNPNLSIDEPRKWEILEEMTQYLLNDSQTLTSSDENCIMSRVNSLCCLLQKDDVGAQNAQARVENERDLAMGNTQPAATQLYENQTAKTVVATQSEIGIGNDFQQGTSMSRKDSVGELLLHLPRIASLPQFLFPEDSRITGR